MKKIHFLMLMALATQSSFAVQNHPQGEQLFEGDMYFDATDNNNDEQSGGEALKIDLPKIELEDKEEQSRLQWLLSNKNARLAMLALVLVGGWYLLNQLGVSQAAYEQLQQHVNTLSPETKEMLIRLWDNGHVVTESVRNKMPDLPAAVGLGISALPRIQKVANAINTPFAINSAYKNASTFLNKGYQSLKDRMNSQNGDHQEQQV